VAELRAFCPPRKVSLPRQKNAKTFCADFFPSLLDWQNPAARLTCAMRLHDRYLFRELLTPLAFCLGGFLVFWASFFFFTEVDKMKEQKLELLECAQYALAMMPGFFVLVLPVTLLLALLYALTQHARHHELTALRAAGVSLWRLCAPYFVVGLLACGIHFLLNEVAAPRGAEWAQEILDRHVKNKSKLAIKTRYPNTGFRIHAHRVWQVGEYDAKEKAMFNPNVIWTLPDGSLRSLQADRADRTNGMWGFTNVRLFEQVGARTSLLPLLVTNYMVFPEFDETPRQILSDIKMSDSQSLRASRSADIPLNVLRSYLRLHPHLPAADAQALRTKLYGRYAATLTCLVVVFIAIPFGAPSGRRNLFFGVAGSIFICFAFFVLQSVGLTLGIHGHLSPGLAAWLPNLFFTALGTMMIIKTR
jgi:lipopolysaccharide export system permease protein